MATSELIFIPSPGAGHLPPTVELANLLLHRDHRISATVIIMKLPLEAKHDTETPASTDRLRFVEIPADDSTKDLISPNTYLAEFIEYNKPRVATIVRGITESEDSVRLAGFVLNMFSIAMADVADEFGSPTYLYFTSGAGALGLMYYLQAKRDQEQHDVTELKDSESELSIPSYINPVPAKVLPMLVFDKNGGSKMFLDLAKRFRKSKAIMVNTFQELESHAIESFLSGYGDVPPVFPVGPIVNLKNTTYIGKADEVMTWLNEQPESSVVFLCFGSMGSFREEQVKEIAVAIERSGQRFLWSLRRPPKEKMEYPKEYENPEEVLPEGFLERTSGIGKVIGWAPQTAVLSHPSVGGFVSHCGWNSTLESIWFGVPIAAWPIDAEQQLNAFQLMVEFGMAAEIKMDYQTNMRPGGKNMFVTAEEIESGIRRVMSDSEIKNKVKVMKEKTRTAVSEGGSSYRAIRRFIDDHLMIN